MVWDSLTERKCSLTLYNLLVLEAIRTDKCLSIDLDWLLLDLLLLSNEGRLTGQQNSSTS